MKTPRIDNAADPVVSARNLTRVFGSGTGAVTAVDNVNLEVLRGEFVAVVGPSGSGKTTLLNLLGGLDKPTSGSVFFEGRNLVSMTERGHVELRRKRVGFVFQSFALLPLLSAYENVELPLRINGISRPERRRLTEEALETVGLNSRARHRPYELSGGEQQRVGIARALVTSPQVVIADEPTGELDLNTGLQIAAIFRNIVEERGTTLIIATHDLALADVAGRIIAMTDGAIVDAPPETSPLTE